MSTMEKCGQPTQSKKQRQQQQNRRTVANQAPSSPPPPTTAKPRRAKHQRGAATAAAAAMQATNVANKTSSSSSSSRTFRKHAANSSSSSSSTIKNGTSSGGTATGSSSSGSSSGSSSDSSSDVDVEVANVMRTNKNVVPASAATSAERPAAATTTTTTTSAGNPMGGGGVGGVNLDLATDGDDENEDDDDDDGDGSSSDGDVDVGSDLPVASVDNHQPTLTFSPPGISRKDERLIAELRVQIPEIFECFNLHQRIGEGTFSTVFLATLRSEEHRTLYKRKCFAIKHLIPTSHPTRVERELQCMLEIGGVDNVAGIDLCIRRRDAVAFVMPFVRHDKFHDYFNRFDARELQQYMRNLLLALRRVHSFGIIHRDVKPNNFLHDRKAKRYLLVDFGLAQCVRPPTATAATAEAAATIPSATVLTSTDAEQPNQQHISTSNSSNQPSGSRPADPTAGVAVAAATAATAAANANANAVKKRKATEIEETENCSNAAAPKRIRTNSLQQQQQQQTQQQQQQHQTANQYSNVVDAATPASASIDAVANAAAAVAAAVPFKTPLKQLNEISTKPRGGGTAAVTVAATEAGSKSLETTDSPLVRNTKTAVLGYSLSNKLHNARTIGTAALAAHPTPTPPPAPAAHPHNSPLPPGSGNANRRTASTRGIGISSGGGGSSGGVACYCYGKPTICNLCIIKKEVHASRAGTPGYRPPEVLLKHTNQTTAVDMWAIGVIMISILSACYPFFKGADDFTALAEMITIFGDEAIKKAALSMSRHVCHSQKKRPLHLRKLCIRLRNRSGATTVSTTDTTRRPTTTTPQSSSSSSASSSQLRHNQCDNCQQIAPECLCRHSPLNMDFAADIYPASAYDLMSRLLCINPAQRITAEEALQHPFMCADL